MIDGAMVVDIGIYTSPSIIPSVVVGFATFIYAMCLFFEKWRYIKKPIYKALHVLVLIAMIAFPFVSWNTYVYHCDTFDVVITDESVGLDDIYANYKVIEVDGSIITIEAPENIDTTQYDFEQN